MTSYLHFYAKWASVYPSYPKGKPFRDDLLPYLWPCVCVWVSVCIFCLHNFLQTLTIAFCLVTCFLYLYHSFRTTELIWCIFLWTFSLFYWNVALLNKVWLFMNSLHVTPDGGSSGLIKFGSQLVHEILKQCQPASNLYVWMYALSLICTLWICLNISSDCHFCLIKHACNPKSQARSIRS